MRLMHAIHRSKLHPWLVWGLAAIMGLFAFLLQGTPSVMIADLMKVYEIDLIQIGLLTSSFFYTYILMQVPAGIVIDQWGPRRVSKVSFLLLSLSIGWFAFSTSFWEGQVSRMLMGVFASPAIISAFCLGSRWFKPHLFALIVTLTEFFVLAGGVIGEGGMAKLVNHFGWREGVIIVSLIGLILAFLSLIFIHDYPNHDQPLHGKKLFKDSLKRCGKNFVKVISIPHLWISGIYAGLLFAVFPSFGALWSIPYFVTRYHLSVPSAALIASTFFLGACFGALILGWISFYLKRRRPFMIWGAFLSFILSLGVIFIPEVPLLLMYGMMFFFGFFSATYILSFVLASAHMPPEKKGVAMGFTNMLCMALGAPLLQPLIGGLLKWSSTLSLHTRWEHNELNNYRLALAPLSLFLFLAFILAFFIKERVKLGTAIGLPNKKSTNK